MEGIILVLGRWDFYVPETGQGQYVLHGLVGGWEGVFVQIIHLRTKKLTTPRETCSNY